MHLAHVHKNVKDFDPHVVIIDPISNLSNSGSQMDAEAMLLRLVDFLKARGTTAMLVSLTTGGNALEASDVGVSSIIDTWLLVRDIELGGERNRGLYVLKSRGMKHSNQIREFLMTSEGIKLEEVYVGREGVLTGSMRVAQEEREKAAALAREQELERKQRELDGRRAALEAQIAALRAEFDSVQNEAALIKVQDKTREQNIVQERAAAQMRRDGEAGKPTQGNGKRNRK
jgi:circadian clock protein KaiC